VSGMLLFMLERYNAFAFAVASLLVHSHLAFVIVAAAAVVPAATVVVPR